MAMYCSEISKILIFLSFTLTSAYACGPPPALPYVDMNFTTSQRTMCPGTVLHFNCSNSTSSKHHEKVTVTMVCLTNNKWEIHGASHCEPERCYVAFAIILTASVIAVSSATTYIATMVIIWILNRKSRYHKIKGDADDDLHKPLKMKI
ncbi:uncharacterized protein LOC125679477 [Ostrea edulis]|uniref:uncharacterized protein LOC125679477 n=1 Tax=Ostrea edulis TaxID=37623 RepID=UPI0024AFB5FE|nr:uncharacterized protein LOC125679477 [Ostrea edulis]